MEKDKKYNVVLGLMIFFFILFVGVCVAWGLGFIGIQATQTNESKENSVVQNTETLDKVEDTANQQNSDDININDLFAFDIQSNDYGLILKVENDELKYHFNDYKTMEYSYPAINSNNENFKVLDTNVKRIKTVTLGSDTWLSFIIIKNDGTTYLLTVKGDYSGVSYEKYGMLAEYKIDNISNINTVGGMSAGFEADVTLIDGTNKHIVKTFEAE